MNAARSSMPVRPADGSAVVVCLACRLDFDHFTASGEPGYFAAVHNGLHHGHRPEAFVTSVEEPGSSLGGDAA